MNIPGPIKSVDIDGVIVEDPLSSSWLAKLNVDKSIPGETTRS